MQTWLILENIILSAISVFFYIKWFRCPCALLWSKSIRTWSSLIFLFPSMSTVAEPKQQARGLKLKMGLEVFSPPQICCHIVTCWNCCVVIQENPGFQFCLLVGHCMWVLTHFSLDKHATNYEWTCANRGLYFGVTVQCVCVGLSEKWHCFCGLCVWCF